MGKTDLRWLRDRWFMWQDMIGCERALKMWEV
jgi:hypothetical protein